MGANMFDRRRTRRWQFSLKSLLFLMFIVALCTSLFGISPVLAIAIMPFFALALVRTMRAIRKSIDDGQPQDTRHGLFSTFCRSLVLVISLLVVSIAAVVLASIATALVLLAAMTRRSGPFVEILWLGITRAWRLAVESLKHLATLALYSKLVFVLKWSNGYAVVLTTYSFRGARALLRHFWYPDIRRSASSAASFC